MGLAQSLHFPWLLYTHRSLIFLNIEALLLDLLKKRWHPTVANTDTCPEDYNSDHAACEGKREEDLDLLYVPLHNCFWRQKGRKGSALEKHIWQEVVIWKQFALPVIFCLEENRLWHKTCHCQRELLCTLECLSQAVVTFRLGYRSG